MWMKEHDDFTGDYIDVLYPELNETGLQAPALNISAYNLNGGQVYGPDWVDPRTQKRPFENLGEEDERLSYAGDLYSQEDLERNGKCQPTIEEVRCPIARVSILLPTRKTIQVAYSRPLNSPGIPVGILLHPGVHRGVDAVHLVKRALHTVAKVPLPP